MVSQQIKNSLERAKAYLDALPQLGVGAFDACDGVLTNIKGLIHEDAVWEKISVHEKKVHVEFDKRMKKFNDELRHKAPMDTFQEAGEKYARLRHWRSLEMLNFYDKLSKEYDI